MRAVLNNVFVQWLILILAVMAGFLVVKYLASYLPDSGFVASIKAVVLAA